MEDALFWRCKFLGLDLDLLLDGSDLLIVQIMIKIVNDLRLTIWLVLAILVDQVLVDATVVSWNETVFRVIDDRCDLFKWNLSQLDVWRRSVLEADEELLAVSDVIIEPIFHGIVGRKSDLILRILPEGR